MIRFRRALVLENPALRHLLQVLQRTGKRRRFRPIDRGLWVLLSRLWTLWRGSLVLVKPETVVRRHRKGFRLYWRWKSGKPGRPRVPMEVRDLIRRECLDPMILFNETHLRRVLHQYFRYYMESRTQPVAQTLRP